MSSTADFAKAIDRFRMNTVTAMTSAPQIVALELWELLVDATPVLSGLTRANWKFGVNTWERGPVVELSETEYRERQKDDGDPLPRPASPSPGEPHAGDVYYISNGTVDPRGHVYLWHILDGTPSQPRPWFNLALEEVKSLAPALITARMRIGVGRSGMAAPE